MSKIPRNNLVDDRPIPVDGIGSFYMRHRASLNDLGVLAAAISVVTYICYAFDIFVTEGQVSNPEQTIELDEVLLLGVLLAVGLLAFGMRRYSEQKKEMRRRLEAEAHARKLAFQDPLTGLANRRQFEDALKIAAAQSPAAGSSHAILMMDLNGFKRINDNHGHGVGDEVLVVVARRLVAAVRTQDLVARLGGDEFVVLAPHVLGPEGAGNIAARIVQALALPVVSGGLEHNIGTGIGIALLPDDAAEPSDVLRMADVALYRAKVEHRSAVRFFEEDMDRLIREREALERALGTAVQNDLIQPRFRPTIDLETGAVVNFEVLPSWISDTGEEIGPERFLAVAEETGLIHRLGLWLIERACIAAADWPETINLSVSLLPGQIKDPDLGRNLLNVLTACGFAPARLELAVSESFIVTDLESAKTVLAPLQEAGIRVTLDNFGTGYSNLYHIRELQFDKVKIDRRITEKLGDDEANKVIRALAGLGHGLGMVVSADSPSNVEGRQALLQSGIAQAQTEAGTWSAIEATGHFFQKRDSVGAGI